MLKINNDGCIMIVIEDAQSMFCHHDEIQKALKKISIKNGTILFDTLLHSGIGERRFITVELRDGEIWGDLSIHDRSECRTSYPKDDL